VESGIPEIWVSSVAASGFKRLDRRLSVSSEAEFRSLLSSKERIGAGTPQERGLADGFPLLRRATTSVSQSTVTPRDYPRSTAYCLRIVSCWSATMKLACPAEGRCAAKPIAVAKSPVMRNGAELWRLTYVAHYRAFSAHPWHIALSRLRRHSWTPRIRVPRT
jgi:hypothetical protein